MALKTIRFVQPKKNTFIMFFDISKPYLFQNYVPEIDNLEI